jgi:hypothetical protein
VNDSVQTALSFLQKALPWIGAAATGNVPALIGLAASKISEATGTTVEATPGAIATAVAGATPEQLLAIQQKELEMKDHALALGFQNAQEMAKIGLQQDALVVDDVKDARKSNAQNDQLWVIAWLVLLTFGASMGAVLYGCYAILSGGITIKDVAVVAAIAGLVGSIVGYIAANAQTVINFLFGGSLGSRNSSAALSASVQQSIQQLGGVK